jgi:hypothetical protein
MPSPLKFLLPVWNAVVMGLAAPAGSVTAGATPAPAAAAGA